MQDDARRLDELKCELESLLRQLNLERDTLKRELQRGNRGYTATTNRRVEEIQGRIYQVNYEVQEILAKRSYIPNREYLQEGIKGVNDSIENVKEEINRMLFPRSVPQPSRQNKSFELYYRLIFEPQCDQLVSEAKTECSLMIRVFQQSL